LKDAFEALKVKFPGLSFRAFAKKAGFSSPNFLQMVIQGKRNLSSTYTVAAARAFKLNKAETEFFQNLVGYGQARNADEKNLFYQKILRNKRYTTVKTLDKSQYDFFSHWYIPVVRELLVHKDFNGENAWIAERVFPRITVAQVESAKDLLKELGLIQWEEDAKRWTLTDHVITTASEATHLGMRNYHMSAIQLAHDSLRHFTAEQRDIRSVTIGLNESAYAEMKSRMEAFWKELLDFAGAQQDADAVYQVNLQLFPLTKERKNHDAQS
jgi:uncharacterized protein (TIGR02147 family)